ncbi:MAG: hypothetical protein IBX58_14775 [Roseovarius sp.]|nr:hypothetical protein [Roseovarius sp.]
MRNAVVTISEIMRDERATCNLAALPALADQTVMQGASPRRAGPVGRAGHLGLPLLARLRVWRPTPEYLGWAGLFLAVLIWPRAVLIAMLAVFVLCLVGVALFGQQRLAAIRDQVAIRVRRVHEHVTPGQEDDPFDGFPDPFERLGESRRDRLGP